MEKNQIDLAQLGDEEVAEELAAALEQDEVAEGALWTAEFAASGKSGKQPPS
jgi:hypothetical protein